VADAYRVAQIAVETARANLNNSGSSSDITVQNSYESVRTSVQGAAGALQSGLADGEVINNAYPNNAYEALLDAKDVMALVSARQITYPMARAAQNEAMAALSSLTTYSTTDVILSAGDKMKIALQRAQQYLGDVQRVLQGTLSGTSFSATELATKKALIDGDYTAVSTQLASVSNALQVARSAEASRTTSRAQLQNAYDTALTNLTIADRDRITKVQAAETSVALMKAAMDSAQAAYDIKTLPPRAVDLAPLRAQLADARAAQAQAAERLLDVRITAPATGTITDILPSVGELVAAGTPALKMIGEELFQVEALVPEADIAKIHIGQPATVTLDAFGDRVLFEGSVLSEDPDQTKIQDAIYYKLHITFAVGDHDVKPGMTANITILTAKKEGALTMPSRALREENGRRFVRVLDGATVRDVTIETGVRADGGLLEVMSGLQEGQNVIVGELTADEYRARQAAASVTKP
jgi:RND family efflux transporter MFP subunit